MTRAEHYAEAERLLEASRGEYIGEPEQLVMIQQAQVHATLASVPPGVAMSAERSRPQS